MAFTIFILSGRFVLSRLDYCMKWAIAAILIFIAFLWWFNLGIFNCF